MFRISKEVSYIKQYVNTTYDVCVFVDMKLLVKKKQRREQQMDHVTVLTRMFIFTLVNLFINVLLRASKPAHITGSS